MNKKAKQQAEKKIGAIGPRYPKVVVKLVGEDGNAFAILGRIQAAMKKAKVPQEQIEEFLREATSGDYDHLLQICLRWVTCK